MVELLYKDLFDYEMVKKQNEALVKEYISNEELQIALMELLNSYISPIIQMSNHSYTEINIKVTRLIQELYLLLNASNVTEEQWTKHQLFIKQVSDLVKAQYLRSVGGIERKSVYSSTHVSSKPLQEKDEESYFNR